jgi:hypothetical protein
MESSVPAESIRRRKCSRGGLVETQPHQELAGRGQLGPTAMRAAAGAGRRGPPGLAAGRGPERVCAGASLTDTTVEHPVGVGLSAVEGFAPGDLTSPVRALRAGALVDVGLDSRVTELRIHGVSGSSGSTMLEHPVTVQVAGHRLAGFHRRWTPAGQGCVSVPWRAEAYSWRGLTQVRLASALWILLVPFMLYNLAHFMLPPRDRTPQAGRRNRVHDVADGTLRLLALAATLQMVIAMLGALLDSVVRRRWLRQGPKSCARVRWDISAARKGLRTSGDTGVAPARPTGGPGTARFGSAVTEVVCRGLPDCGCTGRILPIFVGFAAAGAVLPRRRGGRTCTPPC